MRCIPALPRKTRASASRSESGAGIWDELAREIEARSKHINLAANCALFQEDDEPNYVYLVKTGEIAFTIGSAQRSIPCVSIGKDSLIGLSAVFSRTPHALTAISITEVELLQMDADSFLGLIESRTEWYMCALRSLAEEALRANHALAKMLAP